MMMRISIKWTDTGPMHYLLFVLISALILARFDRHLAHNILCFTTIIVGIALAHLRWPLGGISNMQGHLRLSQPFHRLESEAEQKHGYSRVSCRLGTLVELARGKSRPPKPFVLLVPEKRSETCVLYIAGFGRYFSHTNCNADFKNADLCGLDLPLHGRSYHLSGLDQPDDELSMVVQPEAGAKWSSYYYDVLDNVVLRLKQMGYREVFLMGDSSSALIVQCYHKDVLSTSMMAMHHSIKGIIYSSPLWRSPASIFQIPLPLLTMLTKTFPKLIFRRGKILPDGVETALDVHCRMAVESGRTDCAIDPLLDLSNNRPWYLEWLCMVVEAQDMASRPMAAEHRTIPSLLLTSNSGAGDLPIDVDAVHEIFARLQPAKLSAARIEGACPEVLLSPAKSYEKVVQKIDSFVRECLG